jgi:hypothetical protein
MDYLGPNKSKTDALYEIPFATNRFMYVYHVFHCTIKDFQTLQLSEGTYLLVSPEATLREFEFKNGHLKDLGVNYDIDELPEYLIESIYFGPRSVALSEKLYPKILVKPGLQSFLHNEIGLYGKKANLRPDAYKLSIPPSVLSKISDVPLFNGPADFHLTRHNTKSAVKFYWLWDDPATISGDYLLTLSQECIEAGFDSLCVVLPKSAKIDSEQLFKVRTLLQVRILPHHIWNTIVLNREWTFV